MKLIPLTQGQFAKVGIVDFKKFSKFKWYAQWCRTTKSFYARRNISLKSGKRWYQFLHREIMGNPLNKLVDHKNHDTLDCRRRNLRVCTKAENNSNLKKQRSNSTSGARGVNLDPRNKTWKVRIQVKNKRIYLGRFINKREATAAYRTANKKYFGTFGGL